MRSAFDNICYSPLNSKLMFEPKEIDAAQGIQWSKASIVIITLFVALVFLPIAFMGVPDGFDLMQHMRFAAAYHDAILSGDLIPKWSAWDNFGFGGIGIRYYPPLAYYVLALTKIVTGSWYHSFWINTLFWGLLGSFGVYAWIREWTSERAATIAAVAYAIVPYHTFQIYQAVLYAEFAASGILPFCFLFLTRLCRRQRWFDAVLFSISYSLLILTHIPTAIIATLCIGVYGLVIVDWKQVKDTAIKVSAAVVMSGLAASFHLVRAVTEVDWVKHNSPQFFGQGYYDYKSYFFPIYFSAPPDRYVQKMLWHFDTMIFFTVAFFTLAIVARYLLKDRVSWADQKAKFKRAITLTGIFSLLMLSIASSFLWNNVSLLAKIQFPWRWLSVASLMAAASFGIAASVLLWRGNNLNRRFAYPIIFFVVVVTMYDISQNIIPSTPLEKAGFDEKVAGMYDEEACECWWPIWGRQSAFENREKVSAGARTVDIASWNGTDREFSIGSGSEMNIRVATFYHPHWKAIVNGQARDISSGDDGTISISLPSERSQVSLSFVEPNASYLARGISLAAWIVLIVFLLIQSITRKRPEIIY